MLKGEDDKERARAERAKVRASFKRDSAISRLRAIHAQSLRVSTKPNEIPEFLVAAAELDRLWTQFEMEDDSILDSLIAMDASEEYSSDLPTEIRKLVDVSKAIARSMTPLTTKPPDSVQPNGQRASRLPEIPLPSYGGELSGWPVFRDRYTALIANRPGLSNIERFYYLLGCLTGDALDVIKNIPVSESTYNLAWSTLEERFDKPRQLAAVIIEKLISAPVHAQESLDGLKSFLVLFSDHVAALKSLKIPSLDDFLLFALSSRCLPLSTRKTFEAVNKNEFPTFNDVVSYVKTRVSLLEAVGCTSVAKSGVPSTSQLKPSTPRFGAKATKVSLVTSNADEPAPSKCFLCSGNHPLITCSTFIQLSLDEKYDAARKRKICFRCLDSTHWSKHCKSTKSCTKCSGRHHTLLHRDVNHPNTSSCTPPPKSATAASLVSSLNQHTVLLGTALVHVRDRAGYMQPVRAVIDSASQISAMTTACVDRLGLRKSRWSAPLTGLSGVPIPSVTGSVDCYVTPRHANDVSLDLNVWVMPTIVADMPATDLPATVKDKFSQLALADPTFDQSAPIDMLLGADAFSRIMDGKRVLVDDSLPVAYGSIFGWVLIGAFPVQGYQSQSTVSLSVSLEDLVQRFWQIEEPDEAPATFTSDGQCESLYASERSRDASGRFLVPLPFIPALRDETFHGSRNVAMRRFQNLERKLQTDDALYTAYKQFMCEYESLGHMSLATEPGIYFIPHHPVFKSNSPLSKIRVVFDASAKSAGKMSLNQCLYAGPK